MVEEWRASERKYPDWEVINTSVSGYGTDQQYLYLKERGIAYRPDVVLLLFYANDFANNNAAEQYSYYKPYFSITDNGLELQNTPVPPATVWQHVDRFLLGRTYLYRKLYSPLKIRYLQLRSGLKPGSVDDPTDPYTITRQLITVMWELAEANDATLALVSVPSRYMSDDRKAVLHDVSQTLKMPYLSLEPYFERATEPVTFPRDLHWNPQGHRLAAAAIAEFLRAQHLL